VAINLNLTKQATPYYRVYWNLKDYIS